MAEKKIKVTFTFHEGIVTRPITYHLVKDYNLVVNILHADVSLNKVGKLTLDITGEEADLEAALKFIKDEGIEYKLFTKSIIWQEEGCVHCGACTAVCPSGALHIEGGDWGLGFDRDKCLVCEFCVRTCPLRVINVSF